MTLPTKKKLLVLDVNGLLIERFGKGKKLPKHRRPDGKVGKFSVYRRPYCNEFLAFCFENFEVGIWSSAQKHNVEGLVDFIFGDLKCKLVFIWYHRHCTNTGLKTLENKFKPLVLKELYKLWDKVMPDLPWTRGDYGPFNTLLIDDSPYKAMRNPPHTAIFPYPYEVSNEPDNVLVGTLLKYLEGISAAINVQHYVNCHQFGQPPISKKSPHWHFYRKILFIGLPTVNQNPSSVVRTKMSGVADKTMTSIAYNNGTTQSSSIHEGSIRSIERVRKEKRKSVIDAALSQKHGAHNISAVEKEAGLAISQQFDLDMVSKDGGLSEIAVTCMTERNDSSVTTLSQKHATHNGPEESGVANATKSRKRKKKSAEKHALNQKHGAPGAIVTTLSQKHATHNGPEESVVANATKRRRRKKKSAEQHALNQKHGAAGAIVTTLSQKHATSNGLEESGAAKATKPGKKKKNAEQAALNQEPGARSISPVEKEAAFAIPEKSDLDQVSKGDGAAKAAKPKKKKRKGAEQVALNQEHVTHNISPGNKEVAFGIPQQCDLDMVSKDNGLRLFETEVTCTARRHGAIIIPLSQKHATFNGLEENGAAKAAKPRKKKRKGAEQLSLNQEHGIHNISPVDKVAAFGIPKQSDLYMVSKIDRLPRQQ